jgi:predicted CopG family antitoxin
MGSKTVGLDDDVYERLRDVERDDETYSEAVKRLLPGGSLLGVTGILEPEEVEAIEDRLSEKYARSKEHRRAQFEDRG